MSETSRTGNEAMVAMTAALSETLQERNYYLQRSNQLESSLQVYQKQVNENQSAYQVTLKQLEHALLDLSKEQHAVEYWNKVYLKAVEQRDQAFKDREFYAKEARRRKRTK